MGIDRPCLEHCYPSGLNAATVNAACLELCFKAAGWSAPVAKDNPFKLPLYASIIASVILLALSGLFSGLNLGLLSLDLVSLRILEKAGDPEERKWASSLIPVRSKGNLLLCTILLGNTLVNSANSILMADLMSGVTALLISTFAILLLGEIIPQAYFCRNSLKFGAKTLWLTKFFVFLLFPICYPISFVLDKTLARDIGTVYSQDELKHLIELHVEDPDAQKESGLTTTDRRLLTGVFEYKDKQVKNVMTKLEDCFCLEQSMRLNFQTLSNIYLSGCSRIPVYHGDRQNIVGILFVKDLILVDPDDELEISTVMAFRARSVSRVYEDVTLDKVLAKFLSGRSHMLIAHAAPAKIADGVLDGPAVGHTPVTGLITLEDVMEELISMEIYDETDISAVELKGERRSSNKQHQQAMFMSLFEHKMRGSKLSPQEVQAVCSFLALNIQEFRSLASSDLAFRGLIRSVEVVEQSSDDDQAMTLGTAAAPYGSAMWREAAARGGLLYERGKATPFFTLILQGKVMVHTGDEGFDLDLGPWSHMGNKALHPEPYTPNFDAVAVPPFRIVRIHRAAFLASLDAMRLEHARGFQSIRQHINSLGQAGLETAGPLASPAPESSSDTMSLELSASVQRPGGGLHHAGSLNSLSEAGPITRVFNKQPSFVHHSNVPHPMGSPPLWHAELMLPPRPSSAGALPSSSHTSAPHPAPFWPRPMSPPPGAPPRSP